MTDYTSSDEIMTLYSNQGTAVPNGMNFGSFQTDIAKNYNPGVLSGNPYPWLYTIMPNEDDEIGTLLDSYTIPASSSGYIPLSNFNSSNYYFTLGTGNSTRFSLKTAVNLLFSVAEDGANINLTCYGWDQHKQKMVATAPSLTDADTPVTTRILKDYTAIYYQNLAATPAQLTIKLGSVYELRFFDVIQNSILFASSGIPLYRAPNSDAQIIWNFNYSGVQTNPLVPLTPSSTICRPTIEITEDNPSNIKGNIMCVTQNVWGMGNFPNIPSYPFIQYAPDLINNLRTVIGAAQPTDGWVAWQR